MSMLSSAMQQLAQGQRHATLALGGLQLRTLHRVVRRASGVTLATFGSETNRIDYVARPRSGVPLVGIHGFGGDKIPLIFLTAKTMKEDILKGYNLGADDYITKPFDTEVLLCKIKAVLKRGNGNSVAEKKLFELGSYHFDVTLRQISREGQIQKLSPKEAELLRMLCERQNDLLPRETALNHIWGDDGYFTARSMDVFVSRLRKYFADDPSIEIKNIHGSGFLLEIKS